MVPISKPCKHLEIDALIQMLHRQMEQIPDPRPHSSPIALADAMMAALAMFLLKSPSLLAFDKQRRDPNLQRLFGIERVPCDTQMRTILDSVEPQQLRPLFTLVWRQAQRGKLLESYAYLDGHYILAIDGTGYFSSEAIHCAHCMERHHRDGRVSYYHQMLGAAIVHPDRREVIPLCPEPIYKQDGASKNDCERNATRRFLEQFRREHPKLPVVVVEDAISPNAPHVLDLKRYGMHFILAVKPGDHAYLFAQVAARDAADEVERFTVRGLDGQTIHEFTVVRDVPLNADHPDLLVTFIEYAERGPEGIRIWTWITDLRVTRANAMRIMRAGRSRWKIENETFNTLKNQGYHYEHNYGHGYAWLSIVFALLMMLAFLIDQIQQISNRLFRGAWEKLGSKRLLWERMRRLFYEYEVSSMRMIYEALLYGYRRPRLEIYDTS